MKNWCFLTAIGVWSLVSGAPGFSEEAAKPAGAEEKVTLDVLLDLGRMPEAAADPTGFLDRLNLPAQGTQRLFLLVFADGQTAFPTRSSLFRPHPAFAAAPGAVQAMIDWAHAQGLQVYAAFDLLQWQRPGDTAQQVDLLKEHPELHELNAEFTCHPATEGKFASPFHPQVRTALTDLVAEVAETYPDLDGVLFNLGLSVTEYLGYSEAARVAYIRAAQMDPIDIPFNPPNPEDRKYVQEWAQWRLRQLTDLFGSLREAFREHHQLGQVAALGQANFYRWSLFDRGKAAQDWLDWVVLGYVDEVILEGHWLDYADSLSSARMLVERAGKREPAAGIEAAPGREPAAGIEAAPGRVDLTPLLRPPSGLVLSAVEGAEASPLKEQWVALSKQGPLERAVVWLSRPEEIGKLGN